MERTIKPSFEIKRDIIRGVITGLIIGVIMLILDPVIRIMPSLKQSIFPVFFMIIIVGVILSLKNKERKTSTIQKIASFILFFVVASLVFILFLYILASLAIGGVI